MKRLVKYFTEGIEDHPIESKDWKIGMEIETSFVDKRGYPISLKTSQRLLRTFVETFGMRLSGWEIAQTKGDLITELSSQAGDKILYELGRQNIELSVYPVTTSLDTKADYPGRAYNILTHLYWAAREVGARPLYQPITRTAKDLLVVPDERDANWLELDGRKALEHIARCSAVQFMIDVGRDEAISVLNRLGRCVGWFLEEYPQDILWKRYIQESKARYRPDRYGGPLFFKDMDDYCRQLAEHDVVVGPKLIPLKRVGKLNIPLFLRSIWWHFRLRRFGKRLCIEIRPLGRWSDELIREQLPFVLEIVRWDEADMDLGLLGEALKKTREASRNEVSCRKREPNWKMDIELRHLIREEIEAAEPYEPNYKEWRIPDPGGDSPY